MFDEKQVLNIVKLGKSQSWPYPKVFLALKEAGVILQEVWIEDFRSIYKNGSQEWMEPLPEGFRTLKTAGHFTKAAIQEALMRRQSQKTTYVEFLSDIAAAGVVYYAVDMDKQTVTYRGQHEQDFYIQNVHLYTEKI